MKTKRIFLYLAILYFIAVVLFAQNTNPIVTNVTATNDNEIITVTYDVTDAETDEVTIYMEVSIDDGATWDFDYGDATGDIGIGVTEGISKTITWEYPNSHNQTLKVEIYADDLFGDQVYYARKIYNTVTIGSQVWLKDNLDVGIMIASGKYERNDNIIEKRCYDDDTSNCEKYGGLYYLGEAMHYTDIEGNQGICPNNWHIPTLSELETLKNEVSGSGNALKVNGTSGFTGLLGGLFYDGRYFNNLDGYGFFWSSTDSGDNYSVKKMTLGNNDSIGISPGRIVDCYSIRCIKN